MTLNILLSFAQFERQIIAERTRDKVHAARRRGRWTGGTPILGYDTVPEGGRLVVNRDEAEQVRAIFELFAGEPLPHRRRDRAQSPWLAAEVVDDEGREATGTAASGTA